MAYRKTPETHIQKTDLLESESLGQYLKMKLRQLGVGLSQLGQSMGLSGQMVLFVTSDVENAKGFSSERIDAMVGFLESTHIAKGLEPFSPEERDHLIKLNDLMPKPGPRGGFRPGAGKRPSSLMDLDSLEMEGLLVNAKNSGQSL